MKSILFVAMFLAAQSAHSGMFDKMIAAAAKKMAPAGPTTDSLKDVVITGGIERNLPPAELGTINQSLFSGWKTGGDLVSFLVSKKGGTGYYKIDGTFSVDGKPVEYLALANYMLITDEKSSPRKIEIVTTTGEKASFTIAPNKNKLKVVSINGEKKNISLDLTKDVTIELDGDIPDGTMLKVAMAVNQVGIKSLIDVCYLRSGSKIVVPAAAFRNLNFTPAGGAMFNFKKSFLAVGFETLETAAVLSETLPSFQYTSVYSDGKMVEVKTEPEFNYGLTAKGTDKPADGEISYDFLKPNAARSRPAGQLKKIGLLSFAIGGKTFNEKSVITQDEVMHNGDNKKTKTTTITFPKQSDEAWDAVLEKMYPELVEAVQSEFGAPVLPLETVSQTAAYKSIETLAAPDTNTDADFSRAYKGTKLLATQGGSQALGYGINAPNQKIMNEAGADALLTVKLDFQVEQDGDYGVMVPKLTFELEGKTNGTNTNTKYYTGTVTGKGVQSENIGLKISYSEEKGVMDGGTTKNDKVYHTAGTITAEELDKIARRSDLLAEFSKGLKEIHDKEKANPDYVTYWDLQN